jgi:hypothetical protein
MNFTAPAFEPVVFIPAKTESEIRALPVQRIYAVAHEELPNGGNHWCLYLQFDEDRSVCIDVTPSHGIPSTVLANGSKANMLIARLRCLYSTAATHHVSLSVRDDLTVGTVVDLLVREGRERYEFDADGRGCRQWTGDQIALLEGKEYVTSAAEAEEARDAISKQYPSGAQYPLAMGAYY